MNTPIHVTDAEFENTVLKSTTPVVVDFWAPWCGPCKMIAPVLEKLAAEYGDKLTIAKVNTDDNPQWAMKYGVQGIPTLLFINNGVGQRYHCRRCSRSCHQSQSGWIAESDSGGITVCQTNKRNTTLPSLAQASVVQPWRAC